METRKQMRNINRTKRKNNKLMNTEVLRKEARCQYKEESVSHEHSRYQISTWPGFITLISPYRWVHDGPHAKDERIQP